MSTAGQVHYNFSPLGQSLTSPKVINLLTVQYAMFTMQCSMFKRRSQSCSKVQPSWRLPHPDRESFLTGTCSTWLAGALKFEYSATERLTNQLFPLKQPRTAHLGQLLGRHGSRFWWEITQGGRPANGLSQEHDKPWVDLCVEAKLGNALINWNPNPPPHPGPRWAFDLTSLQILTNPHPTGAYWLVKPPPWWGKLCCSLI